MKKITKYQANDGSEWKTKEDAEKRDILIVEVEAAMSPLQPNPGTIEFANGHGFVRQDVVAVANVRKNLYAIARRDGVLKWWIDQQKAQHGQTDEGLMAVHPSWFSRMLDGAHRPLDRAYSRLCCIDDQYREWGQPYFASHPDKGEQVPLTPREQKAGVGSCGTIVKVAK